VRVAGEAVVEGLSVATLEPVVELLVDRPRELVHELAGVDEVERLHALARDAGGLVEEREVGLDLPRGVRALHLDGDAVAVREGGAVHLADRRGRDRGLLELGEQLFDRELELLADDALYVLVREGAHVVLERLKLGEDVGRNDVGAGREELAELDESRAELVEHLAQVLAPLGRAALGRHALAAGDQVGQTVGLEEVAEAVLDRDLRDLGDAPEVPRLRACHAVQCATRQGGRRAPANSVGSGYTVDAWLAEHRLAALGAVRQLGR
jgi:hypothetical protein